jgi:hypothetical protein
VFASGFDQLTFTDVRSNLKVWDFIDRDVTIQFLNNSIAES